MEILLIALAVFYLIGFPISFIVSIVKNSSRKQDIQQLTQTVDQLKKELQALRSSDGHQDMPTDQVSKSSIIAKPPSLQENIVPLQDETAKDIISQTAINEVTDGTNRDVTAQIEVSLPDLDSIPVATKAAVIPEKTTPAPTPIQATTIQSNSAKTDYNSLSSRLIRWFLEGNPLAKIGVVILFFGLAYLTKYSIDNFSFRPELRLVFSASLSLVLLIIGWRLRTKKSTFALILQGAAIGGLYMTVFAAIKIFSLPFDTVAGLLLMVVICAFAAALSVMQRALSLAILASLGGYLAPILMSDGSGEYIVLFSYYIILSLGILAISVKQSWYELNLLGLLFSFGIGFLWGWSNYTADKWWICQLFLIANIFIFGIAAVILSLNQQAKGQKIIESLLLFVPPLMGFLMQYHIVKEWQYGAAFSALAFGAVYLLFAGYALRRVADVGVRLATFTIVLGGGFITMAVPLAFSAEWTTVVWLCEGLAIMWAGLLQNQRKMAHAGLILMLLATLSSLNSSLFWYQSLRLDSALLPVFVLSIVAYIFADWLWQKYAATESDIHRNNRRLLLLVLIIINWLISIKLIYSIISNWASFDALTNLIGVNAAPALLLLLLMLSTVICQICGRKLQWPALNHSKWLLWPGLLFYLIIIIDNTGLDKKLPLIALGLWAVFWLAVFVPAYYLLRQEKFNPQRLWLEKFLHLLLLLMLLVALSQYVCSLIFPYLGWGLYEWRFVIVYVLCLGLISLLLFALEHQWQPFYHLAKFYQQVAVPLLVGILSVLLFFGNTMDGQMVDWYFIPVFNPLDISALCALVFLARLYLQNIQENYAFVSSNKLYFVKVCALLLIFWWGNGILLRAIVYWSELPWNWSILWKSAMVQTVASLVWAICAVLLMFGSVRRGNRHLWLFGMALLGLTIAKLFLVDGWTQGLWRAITFIGVALLLLLIGYLAPLPPKKQLKIDQLNRKDTHD